MKNKTKKQSENIKLIGKTRHEIIEILGSKYVEDDEGNLLYTSKILFVLKRKIHVGFNSEGFADTFFSL